MQIISTGGTNGNRLNYLLPPHWLFTGARGVTICDVTATPEEATAERISAKKNLVAFLLLKQSAMEIIPVVRLVITLISYNFF